MTLRQVQVLPSTGDGAHQEDPIDSVPEPSHTLLMMAYRSATHEATGVSPNEMVFGRSATLPVDLVLGRPDP